MKRVITCSDHSSTQRNVKSNPKPTNNVKRVMNALGRPRPTFVDRVKGGYRVNTGITDDDEIIEYANKIEDLTGIEVGYRKRAGYSRTSGTYDIIIPEADDAEFIEYNF